MELLLGLFLPIIYFSVLMLLKIIFYNCYYKASQIATITNLSNHGQQDRYLDLSGMRNDLIFT